MQPALLEPKRRIIERQTPRGFGLELRRPERVILAFLIYAQILAFVLPVPLPVRCRLSLVHLSVTLTWGLLVYLDSRKPTLITSVIRDWLPLGFVLLAYREMGWFAMAHAGSALESHWVIWDHLVLRGGGKNAIEALGPILPSVLEIAYTLVYALAPFSIVVLYFYGRRDLADRFLFIFVLGVLLCYAQFPFWPSEPPRVVFFGQDFPAYDTVFRRFNWWLLGNYGIHTSVFPSAHVAGAFSAALGMRMVMPSHRWVSRFLGVMAALIAVATVYGRYHYLADAAAGFAMAGLAAAFEAYATLMVFQRDRSLLHRKPPADASCRPQGLLLNPRGE